MDADVKRTTTLSTVFWVVLGGVLAITSMFEAVQAHSFGHGLMALGWAILTVAWYIEPMSLGEDLRKQLAMRTQTYTSQAGFINLAGGVLVLSGIVVRLLG